MPSSCSSLAVPPVDRICTPRASRARANSSTPVLSETLIRARRMRMGEEAEREVMAVGGQKMGIWNAVAGGQNGPGDVGGGDGRPGHPPFRRRRPRTPGVDRYVAPALR